MIFRKLLNYKPKNIFTNLYSFAKFKRDKPHINVGTIGHIDHGKTTLTSAITRVLAKKQFAKFLQYGMIDNAPQQKARGITINTATIEYQTQKRHYGHVDCPGHIDYVKNMITGAAKMDAGILVVSATDGPMPQTRQHILLCKQIGVQTIIVFLNKYDLVKDPEIVQIIQMQLKEILAKNQYNPQKVKFIKGSALHAMNGTQPQLGQNKILQLLNVMDTQIPIPQRLIDKPFMMPIQNNYSIQGRGIVAVGTVEQGKVKVGDQIEVIGYKNKPVRTSVSTIQTYGKTLQYGEAGENVGLLIRGVSKEILKRGSLLVKPKSFSLHSIYEAQVYCLTEEEGGRKKPFTTGYKPQLYFKTSDSQAIVSLFSDVKIAMPGDNILLRFKLSFPLAMEVGSRFALRQNHKTVGAGIITKVLAENTKLDLNKKKQGDDQKQDQIKIIEEKSDKKKQQKKENIKSENLQKKNSKISEKSKLQSKISSKQKVIQKKNEVKKQSNVLKQQKKSNVSVKQVKSQVKKGGKVQVKTQVKSQNIKKK